MPDQDTPNTVFDEPRVDLGALNESPSSHFEPVNVNLASQGTSNDVPPISPLPPPLPEPNPPVENPYRPLPPLEPTSPPPMAPTPQLSGGGGKKWLLIGIIGVVLLSAGAGAWYLYSSNQKPETVTEDPQLQPQPDPEPTPQPPVLTLEDQKTTDTTPAISGESNDPAALVVVSVEGKEYSTSVNPDGTWEVSISDELDTGTYEVNVTATSAEGVSSDPVVAQLVVKSKPAAPKPAPAAEPEEVPDTGPESSLPNTGPSDSLYPPQ